MPLEFALRPRIRLREDPPQRAPNRRARWRVPRFALPAALYWAAVAGICYGIIRAHDAPAPEPVAEARELAPDPELSSAPAPVTEVPLTQAAPPPAPEPPQAAEAEPEPVQRPAPTLLPAAEEEQPTPLARLPALGEDMSRALLSARAPHPDSVQQKRAPAPAALLTADFPPNSLPDLAPEPRLASAPARGGGSALPSCEAAAAAAVQDLDFASSDRTADLPSEAISGVLENGAWLASCSLPSSTHLDVCVAIKGGRVTAVTVSSRPSDPALNACVKQRAAALQFPYSTRVDVARTRF